jgi:hypothetical protein
LLGARQSCCLATPIMPFLANLAFRAIDLFVVSLIFTALT